MEYAETLKTMVPLLFCFMICVLMFVFCFKDMRGVNVNSIFLHFLGLELVSHLYLAFSRMNSGLVAEIMRSQMWQMRRLAYIDPPGKIRCLLRRDYFKRKFHLPTIKGIKGYISFQGGTMNEMMSSPTFQQILAHGAHERSYCIRYKCWKERSLVPKGSCYCCRRRVSTIFSQQCSTMGLQNVSIAKRVGHVVLVYVTLIYYIVSQCLYHLCLTEFYLRRAIFLFFFWELFFLCGRQEGRKARKEAKQGRKEARKERRKEGMEERRAEGLESKEGSQEGRCFIGKQ